ncbi:hypothetical protein HPP92_007052 [Vanilla planifolia]|uniref:laccase n=1 Tax=Vanilla planifolia TaxID=51239 RepID=A0A835R9F5_VANPL|nr:hypothetical protein HPP92_007052 [Vanilla planifolia]
MYSITEFEFIILVVGILACSASAETLYHNFIVKETQYTRLCHTKQILTVNGQFPGPTIYARRGDTVIVNVRNCGKNNVTIHWHGVNQNRDPWHDGPEYITQCPIQPDRNFTYRVSLGEEEGEWWIPDVREVVEESLREGKGPNFSDAYTINGQPGFPYPCSNDGEFTARVDAGNRYLLRIINAANTKELFFAVAGHHLTVVGTDGSYVKPFTTDFIMIIPGQTFDVLLDANSTAGSRHYIAIRPYSSGFPVNIKNATAVLQYSGNQRSPRLAMTLPSLPAFDDTNAVTAFTKQLHSLASEVHPVHVPQSIDQQIIITVAFNLLPCEPGKVCQGPLNTLLTTSLNNISFVKSARSSVLDAYYRNISGVFGTEFPDKPPVPYDFTGKNMPSFLLLTRKATEVRVLEYNTSVEIVFQGTNILAGENHPLHLHGHSFYVVGSGFGNFDKEKHPLKYNLVDPPYVNTVGIPMSGWAAIRFRAQNPGVWFMHCHFDFHQSTGMATVLIVKDGEGSESKMLPPPSDMPRC